MLLKGSTRELHLQNETTEPVVDEIFEVETYKVPAGQENKRTVWVKNCLYQLTCDERDILRSKDEWLMDHLISASQKIRKEQSLISGYIL